ncbi:MAG: helix-turn-helix domain-containing protein [Steroidobacteraceae bacterium]
MKSNTSMLESMTIKLDDVLVQLREAARCARQGNAATAQLHIGSAIALLARGSGNTGIPPLSAVIQPNASGALPLWRARRIADHIESHMFGPIKIHELAAVTGLSSSHFSRAFKLRFGVSARVYITSRRIDAAQHLMLTTEAPLSEIALRCGMCDQAHFTRVFRRVAGEAPNRWRQSRRNSSAIGSDYFPTVDVVDGASWAGSSPRSSFESRGGAKAMEHA